MCLISTCIPSNSSKKYHVPKNIVSTINSVAKAKVVANGCTWEYFKDRWRRRFTNPYQFFGVSKNRVHIGY